MKENDIISAICSELLKVMGPISPIIISEKIKSLDLSRDDFPMDKIGQLVERISDEIHDQKGKAEFQKGAIEQIKAFVEHAGI